MKVIEIKETLKNLEQRSNCIKRKVAAFMLDDPHVSGVNYIHQKAQCIASSNCLICTQCANSEVRKANNIICMALHAEIDCLTNVFYFVGRSYDAMCVSYTPCIECCKAIIDANIKYVLIAEPSKHHDKIKELLANCGVKVIDLWKLIDTMEIGEE